MKNPPCPKNVRTGQTSIPPTADVFYGRPLKLRFFYVKRYWFKKV